MKKTLLMHAGAMAGAAAMVCGLLAATAPEAESRSGVGNDRTGDTVNNQGMTVSTSMPKVKAPNDDMQPMTSSTTPVTSNHYGTTGSRVHKDVKGGM